MARSQLSVFPKAVNFLGEKKDPERSLWRNVLIVALEDAVGRHYRNKNFGVGEKSAQAYFLEPNRDFALVCHYAGFDHEYVRMKAKKFIKEKLSEEKDNMHSM
jgi:hypothetical protein|tara:strand:- start:555 stop:863 length:309 start_codon:yes stop_codon:yes gene_type:complete